MNMSLSCTQTKYIEHKNHETKNISNSLVEKKEKVFRIKSSCSTGFPMESIFVNLVPAHTSRRTRALWRLFCMRFPLVLQFFFFLFGLCNAGAGVQALELCCSSTFNTLIYMGNLTPLQLDSTLSRFESYLTGRELQRSNNWIDRRDWLWSQSKSHPCPALLSSLQAIKLCPVPWAWPWLSLFVAMLIFIIVWLALCWNPFARQRLPATI